MNLIPEEELKPQVSINFAPMIDFLFLMLAFFATLAITRATLFDSSISLVSVKSEGSIQKTDQIHQLSLSIDQSGKYKWIAEFHTHPMENLEQIQKELIHQYKTGLLPKEKNKTQILLHIDQNAPWNSIAELIFAVREIGFDIRPIYEKGP